MDLRTIVDDFKPDVIDNFLLQKLALQPGYTAEPHKQPEIDVKHNKMEGFRLVFFSLLLGLVVMVGLLAKDNINAVNIYLLSVIAFAGILSTSELV